MNEIEAYIRQTAAELGINPDIAVRVAQSEGGLKDPALQSGLGRGGRREPSFGPFQLLVGGRGTGFPEGVGNRALAAGIDPRDPNQWREGVKFALETAKNEGWGQWYGAARAGVGRREGLGGPSEPARQYALDIGDREPAPPLPPPRTILDRPIGTPAPEQVAAAPEAPQTPLQRFAKAASKGLGTMASATPAPAHSAIPPTPGAAIVAQPDVPTIDPQAIEQQRQMLAMAMQRLNSGKLWGAA